MDYEKKLKDALDDKLVPVEVQEWIEETFPELVESEDERIRKHLIGVVELYYGNTDEQEKKDCLAWLEKQNLVIEMKTPEESLGVDSDTYSKIVDECVYGEQKPAWTEKDERCLNNIINRTVGYGDSSIYGLIKDDIDWLKSLKYRVQPKQEWSEEDEYAIRWIRCICNDFVKSYKISPASTKVVQERVDKIESWLYSLKDRYTWKPSDEQIRELGIVATGIGWFSKEILSGLLEQLKKLKE